MAVAHVQPLQLQLTTPVILKASSSCVIYRLTDALAFKFPATTQERLIAAVLRETQAHDIVDFPVVDALTLDVLAAMPGIGHVSDGLVMKWCNGGDVLDHVIARGPLEMSDAKRFGRTVLRGMAHLKQLGYAHCDIKPENVFIQNMDGRLEFKLGDLGLLTPLKESNSLGCAATVVYGAPEALRRESTGETALAYDLAAADVWSLGVSLAAVVAGSFPWEAARLSDPYFLEWSATRTVCPPRAHAILGLTRDDEVQLATLITTMLHPSPAMRPSIEDLLAHAWFAAE
jgi:serine/threonine protein kinase